MAGPPPAVRQPLLPALIDGWADPYAAAQRRVRAPVEERELLFWAFLAAGLGFLAGLPGAFRQAEAMVQDDALAAVLSGRLFASLFGAPLLFYGVAMLSRIVAKVFGGRGTWKQARIAFFWSLLMASPVLFLGTAGALIGGHWASVTAFAGGAVFLFIWSAHLAPAEQFSSPVRVFGVVIALLSALVVAVFAITS